MTNKIKISKDILEDLYTSKSMSTYKIAKELNCNPSVIQKRLKEYRITARNPKKRIEISKDKLFDLYINKKLSTQTISKILNIGSGTIYKKLKENNIKIRRKNVLKISREELKKLYINKNLSCSKIAKKLGYNKVTIFNKLKKLDIKTRNLSEANINYKKIKFSGNNELKAYMIGFRLGDLNVKAINKDSTIFVKSSTTKKEQLELIKQIYGKYGHFRFNFNKSVYSIYCNLDKSFHFLIEKNDEIEVWILNNNKYFFAFLGGYSDAEGNFGVYDKRARFRLGTYDRNILTQIKNKLNEQGIITKLNLERKAIKGKHNQDFYRISINEKKSLLNFIYKIRPFIKHKKRFKDLDLAEKNILERIKKKETKVIFMRSKKTFYVTTPIYYPTAKPHLGSAYTTIAGDILARWHKLKEENVFFLTGTDEHTKKVIKAAEKQGLTPKEFTDKITPEFKRVWEKLNIKYDRFIRTSDPDHKKFVEYILQKVYDQGDIYKGIYEGLYCVDCEAYYTEKDLVEGCCPIHKKSIENMKEETYFFRLSKYKNQLLELYKKNPEFIAPEFRKNEIINRVKEGLKDLSISRTKQDWGVKLPFDKTHVSYVWFDALTNYLTGIGILDNPKMFKTYWPADVHLVGKDILWFHSVIWPAMLIASKIEQPKKVFAHGWLNVRGNKIGKSSGNAADLDYLIDLVGVDSVRYFLFRQFPFGSDGEYEEEDLINKHNSELANKFGNLVSRVTALAEKYKIEKIENKLLKKLNQKQIEEYFNKYELDKALNEIFAFIDDCNEYIQEKKPWETHDKKLLFELADSIKAIAILLWPFMPNTSEKIAEQLGFKINLKEINKPIKIKSIKKSEILFKKILF